MKELKVMKLKKALVEKRLRLEKLMAQKMQSQQGKESEETEAKVQAELTAKLDAALKEFKGTKLGNKAFSGILVSLKSRADALAKELAAMERVEKSREGVLDKITKDKSPRKADESLERARKLIKKM